MGGDECVGFEIWVGPKDQGPVEKIPRSIGKFDWQQCRFSNIITELKIDNYVRPYYGEEEGLDKEFVDIVGKCGSFNEAGEFVPNGGSETRVLKVAD